MFTANSNAALVSDGPLYTNRKEEKIIKKGSSSSISFPKTYNLGKINAYIPQMWAPYLQHSER